MVALEEGDEVVSLAPSKAPTNISIAQSRRSTSSKTYISKLEKQLQSEKEARLKLEKEVEEIKKINAEISSKLGLSSNAPETPKKI